MKFLIILLSTLFFEAYANGTEVSGELTGIISCYQTQKDLRSDLSKQCEKINMEIGSIKLGVCQEVDGGGGYATLFTVKGKALCQPMLVYATGYQATCEAAELHARKLLSNQCEVKLKTLKKSSVVINECQYAGSDGGYVSYFEVGSTGICE